LYLINGDLTDSEWANTPAIRFECTSVLFLLLNKQDRLPAETREEVLLSLKQRLKETIPAHHILAIAAAPEPLKSSSTSKQWRNQGMDGTPNRGYRSFR
jgi:hypothetical protein